MSTCGGSSSQPTPWQISTLSVRSTGPASKNLGGSANSTAKATSAILAASFWSKRHGDSDDVIVADMDLDLIREVRNVWQFFRDRRPESYQEMVQL